MFEYYYHEILRKIVIGFGTLFNDVNIKTTDANNNVTNSVKVPLAYAPQQKFLARLEQAEDLNKTTQITLPRMSFEFVGLQYDSSRKVTTTQKILVPSPSGDSTVKQAFMPVPYNMSFELNIYTKLNDDMLQIVEQILPYFQPQYNLTIELVDEMDEKRDIPIILEGISMDDQYEGNFDTRRALIYTLRFSAKTYLYGPVASASSDIITRASIGYIAGNLGGTEYSRDLTYRVTPRAIKNYTGTVLSNLTDDITLGATLIKVDDPTAFTADTYVEIDGEAVYITEVTAESIKVKRGQDDTTATKHLRGEPVKSITAADDALIPAGDDFGFSVDYI